MTVWPDYYRQPEASSALDRALRLLAAAGLLGLAFLSGAYIVLTDLGPAQVLRDAHRAGAALIEKKTRYKDPFRTDLWQRARTDRRGATHHDPAKAFPGLTLYTSGDAARAVLVDMDGRPVHEWRRPFSSVWDESADVRDPVSDANIYFRKARLLPNGDLLAIYIGVGDTPWGYGLVKLDRNSEVRWKYLQRTHHDFDVGPDGRIYALTHGYRKSGISAWPQFRPPILEDFLVVLSPDGRELRKVSITEALARSRFERLIHTTPHYTKDDLLHTNSVDLIDAEAARALPFGDEGQVLLSMREPGLIALLDIERETIVWTMKGPWIGQHDPDVLPDGRILLFDNGGNLEGPRPSRVIEVDPRTQGIVWQYAGDDERPLESAIRSAQQRLPNGNTLITESDGGRLLEVTRTGELVWQYVNPVRGGEDEGYIPVVSWGQRIAADSLDPDFRPGGPE